MTPYTVETLKKWDGNGYPKKLSGKNIPVHARITAIADVFDALTSHRPYKPPYPIDVASAIIKDERGKSFEPDLVDIFLNKINSILEIRSSVEETTDKPLKKFFFSDRDKKKGYHNNMLSKK